MQLDAQGAQADQLPAAQLSAPAPVSNLDARLTDAAACTGLDADVFAATATFTPPQSPLRSHSGAASGSPVPGASAAPAVGQLGGDAKPYAHSPLRMPPPPLQAEPSPISLLGGYDEQELMTVTPSGQLAVRLMHCSRHEGHGHRTRRAFLRDNLPS